MHAPNRGAHMDDLPQLGAPADAHHRRRRRLLLAFLTLPALVLFGSLGYHAVEGWSLFDALYMTVITITTVGFGEVHPLSAGGRAFTVIVVLTGVSTFFYAGGELIAALVRGELRRLFGRPRMERILDKVENHMVVCGYGRMGQLVCKELASHGVTVVVIERNGELLRDFALEKAVAIHGDATSDEILERAAVARARALIAVATSDADNLFITISARFLNDRMFIVARAEDEATERKLVRAGANRVISPKVIGGERIALAVLRPAVVDFLELATRTEELELQIEESEVTAGGSLAGKALGQGGAQALEVIVLAIKQASGKMVFPPPPTAILGVGDTLIAVGSRAELDRLDALARGA